MKTYEIEMATDLNENPTWVIKGRISSGSKNMSVVMNRAYQLVYGGYLDSSRVNGNVIFHPIYKTCPCWRVTEVS